MFGPSEMRYPLILHYVITSDPSKQWGRSNFVVVAETMRHRPIGRDQVADGGKGARGVAVALRPCVGSDRSLR
jgi:hypothetical protein